MKNSVKKSLEFLKLKKKPKNYKKRHNEYDYKKVLNNLKIMSMKSINSTNWIFEGENISPSNFYLGNPKLVKEGVIFQK